MKDNDFLTVNRKDLELVLVHGFSTTESNFAWDRLRALLEEPPRCPGCGYTEQDCREQMDHHLCGLPEPAPLKPSPIRFADLPAETPVDDKSHPRFIAGYTAGLHDHKLGQPQGEPIYQIEYLGEGGGGWNDVDKKTYDNSAPIKSYRGRIVYAEQPAPVAVVAGGRRTGKAHLAVQLESLAKQVYQSWESQPGFVPWVEGGNSAKQEEARQIASRTFELALANQVGD